MFRTLISQVDTTPQEELGIWRAEAGKILRYVKAGTAVIPAYECVTHDSTITSATAALVGTQVTQASGPTNMMLGIAEVTMAGSNYGWITVYGPATARVLSGTVPMTPLGPDATATGVLSVRNTSHFNAAALAIASGLSAGSTIFISVL